MLIFIERVALRLMDFRAQAYPDGAVALIPKTKGLLQNQVIFATAP